MRDQALTDLGARLLAERKQLLARWREQVRERLRESVAVQKMSDDELNDHLPALTERLCQTLHHRQTGEVEPEGDAHGRQRREHGYRIQEIFIELKLFRDEIMALIESHTKAHPSDFSSADMHEVRSLIVDVFDRSLSASAERYTADTEVERNQAMAEVRERSEEVERRSAALEEADRQKDHFLAMLSHELRNPIAPILAGARLLRDAALEPRFVRARDIVERQANYLARLIDDLLEVNRIVIGKVQLRKERVDLLEAVHRAVEICADGLEAKSISLKLELPPDPVAVCADPARLVQVVTNLLTNATKFTAPRGHVQLRVEPQGDSVTMRVQDDGIGIERELLPKVFEMFVQADSSLDRAAGGLGVGLTLVKHLVEGHGGRVEVDSQGRDKGTVFTVTLPVTSAPVRELIEAPRPIRVAVIEDNADSRILLAEVLETMGFTVTTAEDGLGALKIAQEERPQAFVIDVGLPGMDGFEVAHRIRRIDGSQPTHSPMLVALTGYGNPEDRKRAIEAGFNHHMTKPANFQELERLLRQVA